MLFLQQKMPKILSTWGHRGVKSNPEGDKKGTPLDLSTHPPGLTGISGLESNKLGIAFLLSSSVPHCRPLWNCEPDPNTHPVAFGTTTAIPRVSWSLSLLSLCFLCILALSLLRSIALMSTKAMQREEKLREAKETDNNNNRNG